LSCIPHVLPNHDIVADNLRSVFANGSHVVILLLFVTSNSVIDAHRRSPSFVIPHRYIADNLRSVFANGSHVVIRLLLQAFNSSSEVHVIRLVSVIPHGRESSLGDIADILRKDFANGAHVVILILSDTFSSSRRVHRCNSSSDMRQLLLYPAAVNFVRVCATGASDVINSSDATSNSVKLVHSLRSSSVILLHASSLFIRMPPPIIADRKRQPFDVTHPLCTTLNLYAWHVIISWFGKS